MKKDISVVIATFNRLPLLLELLKGLVAQTVLAGSFEVIVVDDGSKEPVRERVASLDVPYDLVTIEQANAGPAAARHTGVLRAKGEVIIILDDDMQIPPTFLAEHKQKHDEGFTVVLGHIQEEPVAIAKKPLFERFHAKKLETFFEGLRTGRIRPRGVHLCTGNVSFRRAEYLAVGGFDQLLKRSEDRELGVRLEKHGARLIFSDGARSMHRSDHTELEVWLRRNYLYGVFDLRISRRHPDVEMADPWFYLFQINPVSRSLVALTVVAPTLGKVLSRAAMSAAMQLDELGAKRVAIAGATLSYGLEYFRGVRTEAGSLGNVTRDVRAYLSKRKSAATIASKS